MKKVVLIHSGLIQVPNGANTVMRILINGKDEFLKHRIMLRALTLDGDINGNYENKGTPERNHLFISVKKLISRLAQYSSLAAWAMIYFTDIRHAKNIVKKYISSEHDNEEICFFHSIYPCYYYLKMRKHYQPSVVVLHNNGESYKMIKTYYKALCPSVYYNRLLKMEEYVLSNVDRISFVAESAKTLFLKLNPLIDANKVSFIHNGIFSMPPLIRKDLTGVLKFVCVASISKRKGQMFIIEALNKFSRKEIPNVHFTFVGDGVDRDEFEDIVKMYKLEDYIDFVGSSTNVESYLQKSDIYILPSIDEGLPMAIIEAMRSSLPIVSTSVGGIPEMITEGFNGLFVEPNVDSIFSLIKDVNMYDWSRMGVNSRKVFEDKFSAEKMIEKYSLLFNNINI